MTPAPRPPSAYRVLLGALLLASMVGAPPACSSSENCRDADCPSGHRCTDNVCSAPCTDQGDCELGQNCVTWGFVDGSQGQFCVALDYAANGKIGQYESCASDAACDTLRGFRCIDERCQLPCRSHSDCSAIGICQPRGGATGGVGVCVPQDPAPEPGRFGTRCPSGDECDADAGFVCVSAGVGDLDAYCTLAGCTGDDDCGPGHTCERVRSGRPPCEDACGFAGRPDAPDCVPADRIGASGDFSCGPVSLVQHLCVQRRFCAPCESDADCMAVPNQVCARDASGEKICTTLCDPDATSCPWGNASACAVWDEELGRPTCSHRFGSCRGEGAPCEPCVRDEDCGADGVCISSSFTGERFCLSFAATCSCPEDEVDPTTGGCTGGGCPTSPGGLPLFCAGGDDFAETAIYQTCYGAEVRQAPLSASSQLGCWPPR